LHLGPHKPEGTSKKSERGVCSYVKAGFEKKKKSVSMKNFFTTGSS